MRYTDVTTGSGLSFRMTVRGVHHGQKDMTLIAKREGVYVGHVDFSEFEGVPHIQMIEVPENTRQGIATGMLKELQKQYPGVEIQWGMTTEPGEALRQSIKFHTVVDDEVAGSFDLLAALRVRLKELEARVSAVVEHGSRPLSERDVEVLNTLYDRSRRIEDRISGLERVLWGKSRTKNLIPESADKRHTRVWFHPVSGKVIPVSTNEDHGATVYEWPEKFGLRSDISERADEMHGDLAADWLMVAAMKRGWVRINDAPDGFNVPLVMAASEEAAQRGLAWLSEHMPLSAVQIEIMTNVSKAPRSVRLHGDRLRRFSEGDVLEESSSRTRVI